MLKGGLVLGVTGAASSEAPMAKRVVYGWEKSHGSGHRRGVRRHLSAPLDIADAWVKRLALPAGTERSTGSVGGVASSPSALQPGPFPCQGIRARSAKD